MFINPQFQGGGISVMFWGCFSKLGLGPLVVVEGTMDADKYLQILSEYVVPELKAAQEQFGIEMTFMQDNAPCHKAKRVMEHFQRENIKLLPWPPQSPDLNPIENLWAIIKRRLRSRFEKIPTSKNVFIEQVFAVWDEITPELLHKLAESPPERCNLCLENNGYQTKY